VSEGGGGVGSGGVEGKKISVFFREYIQIAGVCN
jgi:hypothetical protein